MKITPFFSLAYLMGGLRKSFEKDKRVEFKLFDAPATGMNYETLEKKYVYTKTRHSRNIYTLYCYA